MPRDLLHQLLGVNNPNRAGRRDVERKRRLLGLADTAARVFRAVDMLEQLGNDESHVQQETRPGMTILLLFTCFSCWRKSRLYNIAYATCIRVQNIHANGLAVQW